MKYKNTATMNSEDNNMGKEKTGHGKDEKGHIPLLSIEKSDIDMLLALPEFSSWSKQQLARILPYLSKAKIFQGEHLYKIGSEAKSFYILLNGEIKITPASRNEKSLQQGAVGKEALLGVQGYLADVVAIKDSRLLCIPIDKAHEIAPEHTSSREVFLNVLEEHTLDSTEEEAPSTANKSNESNTITVNAKSNYSEWFKALGWLLTLVAPVCIIYFSKGDTTQDDLLNWSQRQFLAAFSVTLVMWVFQLIPMYAAGFFTIIICLSLGVVPSEVVLSGYASGSFFMALSIFGLGSVLVKSGATYRIVLWILKYSPASAFSYNLSLLILGIFLTPMVPSSNGRVGLLSPMLLDMTKSLGLQNGMSAATRLSLSMFTGVSMFSAIFMTSKSLNLLVFSLLPIQRREEFLWLNWLTTAAVAGIVMFVLFLILSHFMFRGSEKPTISKQDIRNQLTMLGPISSAEWFAFSGVVFFLVAVITSSLHKIQLPWVSLAVFFIFLSLGMISNKQMKSDIDWRFLLLLGSMIGMVHVINYTSIDTMLSDRLYLVGEFMSEDFEIFVLIMIVIIFGLRLFLPINAAGMITAAIFIPLAETHGIDPWVVAFVVLMLAECWFFPYQASYYIMFQGIVQKEKKQFNSKRFLQFNALTVLFRIIAIYVSLPFFRYLNML